MVPVRSETCGMHYSIVASPKSHGQRFLRACILHLLHDPMRASYGMHLSFRYSPVLAIQRSCLVTFGWCLRALNALCFSKSYLLGLFSL